MSNVIYPSYKNYLASDAYVYPAANRSDGGEDNSEKNLRTLTDKFAIKGFVVRRSLPVEDPEYFKITFDSEEESRIITVDGGECSVGGYYLNLNPISADAQDLDLSPNENYNILILCVLDSSGLLSGDGRSLLGDQSGQIVSRGVRLQFLTDEELSTIDLRYPYVRLATVSTTVNRLFNPSTLVMDSARYSFIDGRTITASNGQPLEEWVLDRLNYEISHLSQLNYYEVGRNSPSATFKIVPVLDDQRNVVSYDTVLVRNTEESYEGQYPSEVSFSEIEKRTRISVKDGYTTNESDLKISQSGTWNGVFVEIARADHLHDNRYVHLLDKSDSQTIKTPVQFSKEVTTSAGVKGSGFEIKDDGSASLGGSKVKVDSNGNITEVGNVTSTGDITAKRVFNAVWNDYAELYRKEDPDKVIDPGTVIAKVPGKNTYAPVTEYNRNLVVGVCSNTYGHLLGGDQVDVNDNLRNYTPVALAGRVPVKVVKGAIISEGDLMVASAVEGRATTCVSRKEQYGIIIGKSLESSDGSKDKVLIQVFLG